MFAPQVLNPPPTHTNKRCHSLERWCLVNKSIFTPWNWASLGLQAMPVFRLLARTVSKHRRNSPFLQESNNRCHCEIEFHRQRLKKDFSINYVQLKIIHTKLYDNRPFFKSHVSKHFNTRSVPFIAPLNPFTLEHSFTLEHWIGKGSCGANPSYELVSSKINCSRNICL